MNGLWVTTVLAAGLASALLCAVAGYALWLARARPRPGPSAGGMTEYPELDVIVAVFNERELLPGKLRNLARLVYPAGRVRFLIVDGASTDGTGALALKVTRGDDRFLVLSTASPGKAAQLNLALRHARGSWTVVTDVDARMHTDTLTGLMAAAVRSPALGVVGSPVLPARVHPSEYLHWRLLNWLRRREWCRGSASMVTAPCYAFRRALIEQIPEDVTADDLYVAWRVGSLGYPIGLAGPVVHEIRGLESSRALFRQKCRRGAGVLREVYRFLPLASRMIPSLRAAFLIRSALLLLTPLVVLSAGVIVSMMLLRLPALEAGAAVSLSAAVGTVLVRPSAGSRVRRPLALVALLALSTTASLLCYPFYCRRGFFGTLALRLRPKVP